MKTPILTAIYLFSFLTLSYAQDSGHQHTDHLETLVFSYLEMKNALVNDHFEQAQSALQTFSKEVTNSEEMNDHPEHSERHSFHHAEMVKAVNTALEAENIGQLRNQFDEISVHLITALKNQGYGEGLYIQYCPMVDNGDGAQWLSKEEEIRNPYYGAMMLKCGSVEEKL